VSQLPRGAAARALLDRVVDLCGVPPRGAGLQNLRHCIMWTKVMMMMLQCCC
jgi:hypothetical protein